MADGVKMEEKTIAGKRCHIYSFGTGKDAVILWGTYAFTGKEEESIILNLQSLCKENNFTLAAYYVDDWNAEFSPWEAEDSNGDRVFTGNGRETLEWLAKKCMPFLRNHMKDDIPFYIAGYSLSGLFSLWSLYEKLEIKGAVCCSGSLWMDGWKEYIKGKSVPENSCVYLRLGGKEEKTKDFKMARVGDRFREQERIMKADPNVKASIMEWNKGGHFADSGRRLARGIHWILSKANDI